MLIELIIEVLKLKIKEMDLRIDILKRKRDSR
jgi:hypothetical protein